MHTLDPQSEHVPAFGRLHIEHVFNFGILALFSRVMGVSFSQF